MTYINTIQAGVLAFPLIAAVITFPYALHQYHKYGSVSKYRTLIIYSFVLYMLIAFFMVSLPLPDRASTAGNQWRDHLNLIPCRQIWLYWRSRKLSAGTITAYLQSASLWQLLFNILLTMPFGVYLRYYFKQSMRRTVLFSFLLSLFYETSQLTALFGIYPGPYRLADVEDLICNTLGGVLGYQIAYVFTVILPSREEIDEDARREGRRVSGPRRIWSNLFDYLCSAFLYLLLSGAVWLLFSDPGKDLFLRWIDDWPFFCFFSFVQTLMTGGATLGHTICRMTLVSEDGRKATAWQLARRYLALWLFTGLPILLVSWLVDRRFPFINDIVLVVLIFLSRGYFYAYLVYEIFRKEARPMPHDRLSGTKYISI